MQCHSVCMSLQTLRPVVRASPPPAHNITWIDYNPIGPVELVLQLVPIVLFPAAELKYHLKKPQWPQPAPESCKSSEKTRRHKGRQRIEHDRTTLSLLPLTQCQPLTEKVAKEVWNIVHYTIYKSIYIYLFIYMYIIHSATWEGGWLTPMQTPSVGSIL